MSLLKEIEGRDDRKKSNIQFFPKTMLKRFELSPTDRQSVMLPLHYNTKYNTKQYQTY